MISKLIRNKDLIKKMEMCFGIFVLVMVIKSSTGIYIDFLNNNTTVDTSNTLIRIAGMLSSLLAGAVENIFLVIIYVALKFASRSAYVKRLDETDFEKNKNYFRDVIKDYSVSELNYIDKFKLEKKQAYTAKLLELEKNKIIKIDNGKIVKLKQPNSIIDEKFVDSIKNSKVTLSLTEYEELIERNALDDGLITKLGIFDKFKDKKTVIIMTIVFILMFVYVFWVASIQETENIYATLFIAGVLSILVVMIIFLFYFVYSISYFAKSAILQKYKRTEKGKEINTKLDGLKIFMEEFSNIDSKESKHLVLWEDYLIYSVMFDINKKIQEEYSKYFD